MSDTDLSAVPTTDLEINEDKYDFDFYALSKLKKQEKQKVICFASTLFLLLLLLIIFIVLFVKCQKNLDNDSTPSLLEARIQAYQRIAKYGEDCSKDFTCGKYAFCRNYQGSYRCDCQHGFYGDGIGDCKNGYFGIDFKTRTTLNIPAVRVKFPQTEALSVCFWFYLHETITENMAFFTYISYLVQGENSLMLWLLKDDRISVSFKGFAVTVGKGASLHIKKQQWVHLCWVWHFQKSWRLYLNGVLFGKGDNLLQELNDVFPASQGDVLLGQDVDNGHINDAKQMFQGKMTEFFIYSRELTQQDVTAAYQNVPPTKDIVLGWWQFKNSTKGNEIEEIEYPFIHKYFKSKRR